MRLNKLEFFQMYCNWHFGDYIDFKQYGHNELDADLIECLSEELRTMLPSIYVGERINYSSEETKDFYEKLDEYLDYLKFEKEELHYFDMDKSYVEYYIYFFNKKDQKYYRVEITRYHHLDEFDAWEQDNFDCIEVKKKEETKIVTTYELV